ncbi:MAG: hypothetical protein A2846_00310 [Candidatus Doudnabacteria bacterium RIFCSPHIGHO2_01_FULL_49_9]|uniref:Uncharacterized protein n=1 Tax=Candidatus Doudnabacteria bacterium RIFCSPHIGHO2_01_FULL_49_9 TaxID=1817827 RepID=A0A1F5P3C5_9BACT|nr:MAG: hypothetical protein A2846_00310 [Candidatus Doudnabacteria bacterium RIFCSPHIGHO2_01_FULL_49_9]
MTPKPLENLLESYRAHLSTTRPDEKAPKIHVDEIASKVAVFYERMRSIIDYQEEHLLRKNFIGRTLRRRLLLKDLNLNKNIAEPLIKEIIRAGRLPNDTVSESKIGEVQAIIDNFLALTAALRQIRDPREEETYDWLIKVTVNAIEENLFPPVKDTMLSEFMFWTVREKLSISGLELTENEINLQLFMGIQKALLRVDQDQLTYRLLKFMYPDWNSLNAGNLEQIVRELPAIQVQLRKHLSHPASRYFFKLCNYFNTVFYLIGDMLDRGLSYEDLKTLFENDQALEQEIETAYSGRFAKQRSKLHRIALFSILSILLSKIVVAIAIEIPIDKYITHNFSLVNLVLNILIPGFLMLIIILSIKMPSENNFAVVLKEVKAICGFNGGKSYVIKAPKKKNLFTRTFIQLLYMTIFAACFYYLYLALVAIKFSMANIVIFAFFVSLVAATGVKIHNRSKEISMEQKKPKFSLFLIDIFAMPFITVGKWGLTALSRLNILVIIFNLIIELPFQVFIEFVENFRAFIKSQKDSLH